MSTVAVVALCRSDGLAPFEERYDAGIGTQPHFVDGFLCRRGSSSNDARADDLVWLGGGGDEC